MRDCNISLVGQVYGHVVVYLNATKSCAITPIIAQRIDACNSSFAPLFQGVWSTSGW